MKQKFIRFLKDNRAFDEYKKEILPYSMSDLNAQFKDAAEFVLEDGCIFFWKNSVTGIYWEGLNAQWLALIKEEAA